jgi:hypothetical protein
MLATITKPADSDTIVPEYEWRGEYVAALIRNDASLEAIFLQAVLAASLGLDSLGRE